MKTLESDALVVLSAGLTADEQLDEKAVQRMDTGLALWDEGIAPNFVVTGAHSFMLREIPSVTYAEVMRRYAIDHGVPAGAISYEDKSLDTVAQALFTKTEMAVPRDWERLHVVTSQSHEPRSRRIFEYVYGPDFHIIGVPAPEFVTVREKIYEPLAAVLLREVLRGTKPGDDEAIRDRLYSLIPGYRDDPTITKGHLAAKSLLGLLKRK